MQDSSMYVSRYFLILIVIEHFDENDFRKINYIAYIIFLEHFF